MASRGGRYQKIRVIASGGMATVYLGRVLGVGGFERPVAIKVMHPHIATNPEFVSMFLDEARLAARIRHPNVVSTLDVDADEAGVFLIMDYVEGLSLHRVAKVFRAGRVAMPPAMALRIMSDALSGLHAAHELTSGDGAPLHLVHRDVSPQNILVGTDGVSRITDFGVARAESRLAPMTQTGQVKGKLGYMSNEQLRSLSVDRRSDVYAAGIVLWELLANRRLFNGDNEGAVALAAAAGASEAPSAANPEAPAQLDDVVMRALKKEPSERYATAADFVEALEEAAHAAGIRIAKPRAVSQLVKPDVATDSFPASMQPIVARLRSEVAAGQASARAVQSEPAGSEASPNTGPTGQLLAVPPPEPASPSLESLRDPISQSLEPPAASSKTTPASVLTPMPEIVAPQRSRRGASIAVGAALLVAAGASYYAGTASSGGGAPASVAPTDVGAASAREIVTVTAAIPAPVEPAPGPDPAPPTSASSPASSALPPSSASAPPPAPARTDRPTPGRPKPSPTGAPTNFRPRLL